MSPSARERLIEAKKWLADNPGESQSAAAKIFKVNKSTLNMSILRGDLGPCGGQNKILTISQEKAVYAFIKSYLENRQVPTKEIVFKAICFVQKQHGKPSPSFNWFGKWWKKQLGLHKIKTKPIARNRITAQDHEDVKEWFHNYKITLKKYNIQRQDLYNFDESGFRIGCPKGVEVLVPIEVTELYSLSPENRRSVTLIETISANGKAPIPPVIIVQGKYHMNSWYEGGNLDGSELIHLSENGYTTDHIGLRFLHHFIQHTKASSDKPWKLLLMDNQSSHVTPEFTLLATQNHVVPFPFPAHLTYCMQPLDVGVFQPYKHWHNKAVQSATESLDFEYTISSFFRDLSEIRQKTFTRSTIQNAFKKADPEVPKKVELELPTPGTPQTIRQVQYQLDELRPKIMEVLSSPSQHKFESFQRGTQIVLDEGEYTIFHRDTIYQRLQEVVTKKPTNRKRIQKGGELTADWARSVIIERERKAIEKAANKEARMLRQIVNKKKKEQKAAWVAWRAKERLRKKAIKELSSNMLGEPNLYKEHTPPPFPEPGKELIEAKSTVILTEDQYKPQGIVIYDSVSTEVKEVVEQKGEQEMEQEEEEDFICFNLSANMEYNYDSSDSESSLGSGDSDEEGYFVL
ncbi:hypothetical protein B7463_g6116, partial [Scytalidium lignicola]